MTSLAGTPAMAVLVVGAVGYTLGRAGGATSRARLRRLAYCDVLTGLGNRAALYEEQARRAGSAYALLLLDLDGFKRVNDAHGHATGDAVLAEIGRRLAAVILRGGFAVRLGGDEFVLLAPAGGAWELAGGVRATLAAPMCVNGHWLSVGASVGVAYAQPGMPASEVLRRADVAMYRAKVEGTGLEDLDGFPGPLLTGDGRPAARLRDMPTVDLSVPEVSR